MIPVTIQTLIMTAPPSPSIIVLQPEEEATQQRTRRVVPIWIGTAEATQMGIALEKARFSSDALSLAIRQEAPIFIDEEVLEKASFPYVFRKNPQDEEEIAEFHEFLENLAPEDFKEER